MSDPGTNDPQITLEAAFNRLTQLASSYLPEASVTTIQSAYAFAKQAHGTQTRASGDPYIIHPTEVACTLAEMKLDAATLITGLLHDTVEDTPVTSIELESKFGKEISELVDGVTKLSKITFRTQEEKQAENFRKMIVAMAKDIRVIIVKLADRLNNMRTLAPLPEQKQKVIARETLDIYAPLANRLGMGGIKIELEDLCLRFLHPDVYYRLADRISLKKDERDRLIEQLSQILTERLRDYDIVASVSGRAKHFYSIYKKMERRNVDLDEVHDLIAFRIFVDNITECYKSLGVIHSFFKPVPGRFKDYIAMPKANNYQSLHTTVIAPEGDRIEIQIRTHEMHQVAERGIAAHWAYKEGRFGKESPDRVDWVARLLEWQKDLSDPNEFLETVKLDLFSEDVFVFTPNGEVKQLPYSATPIDFAYAVHTDVGHHCVSAKVNGRMVPLKHKLKSGDTIEIITSPHQAPSKDWLKVAATSRARTKIRAFITLKERERAQESGRNILEKGLKRFDTTITRMDRSGLLLKASQHFGCRTPEELYVAVGYGRVDLEQIIPLLISREELERANASIDTPESKLEESILKKIFRSASRRSEARNVIRVEGLHDVLIRFAKCCNPLPGESIVGFVTRGRGVTIHAANCKKALDLDNERRVDVAWNISHPDFKHQVSIRILSRDEQGLLALMSQTITACGVNITSANIQTTRDRKAVASFTVQVTGTTQLDKVIASLESKKGVIAVERIKN